MASMKKQQRKLGKRVRRIRRGAIKGLRRVGHVAGKVAHGAQTVGRGAQVVGALTGQPELIALGKGASSISGGAKAVHQILKPL